MASKLRDRILSWSIASTVLIVLAVVLLVDNVFGTTIRRTVDENVATGAGLDAEVSLADGSKPNKWSYRRTAGATK